MDHTQADVYDVPQTSEVNTSQGGAVWCTKGKAHLKKDAQAQAKTRTFSFLLSRHNFRTGTVNGAAELSITLIRLLHMQWDGPGR